RLTFDSSTNGGDIGNVNWLRLSPASPISSSAWPSSFTSGPGAPSGRWESSSCLMDGKIWVFGGWMSAATEGTKQVEVYALNNNELHYIGGVLVNHDIDTPLHQVLSLNNLSAGWTRAADMPDARDHFASAVLNGKIYCIGGEFGHDAQHLQQNFVDVYDPIAKSWSR